MTAGFFGAGFLTAGFLAAVVLAPAGFFLVVVMLGAAFIAGFALAFGVAFLVASIFGVALFVIVAVVVFPVEDFFCSEAERLRVGIPFFVPGWLVLLHNNFS